MLTTLFYITRQIVWHRALNLVFGQQEGVKTHMSNVYKLQVQSMNTGTYMNIYVNFSGPEREISEFARHWRPQWRDHRPSHLPVHTTSLIPPGGSTNTSDHVCL